MATASGIDFAGGPAGGALLTGPPGAGAITNTPSALVFTAGDAEAGVEGDTPPALDAEVGTEPSTPPTLETAREASSAFGSLQSLSGSA